MITITESAQNKIQEILAEEADPNTRIRLFVQGGGCAGFSYGFSLDSKQAEDDLEISAGTALVLVDSLSLQYLQDAQIDYSEGLMGSNFKINNPQATTTCGCGSSFSI